MSDSFVTPWTVACQVPLSMEFPRQEYWSGLPCPPPGDLPNPGIRPRDWTQVSCIGRRILYHWTTRKAHWELLAVCIQKDSVSEDEHSTQTSVFKIWQSSQPSSSGIITVNSVSIIFGYICVWTTALWLIFYKAMRNLLHLTVFIVELLGCWSEMKDAKHWSLPLA